VAPLLFLSMLTVHAFGHSPELNDRPDVNRGLFMDIHTSAIVPMA
jgi:hypothetical protein